MRFDSKARLVEAEKSRFHEILLRRGFPPGIYRALLRFKSLETTGFFCALQRFKNFNLVGMSSRKIISV